MQIAKWILLVDQEPLARLVLGFHPAWWFIDQIQIALPLAQAGHTLTPPKPPERAVTRNNLAFMM